MVAEKAPDVSASSETRARGRRGANVDKEETMASRRHDRLQRRTWRRRKDRQLPDDATLVPGGGDDAEIIMVVSSLGIHWYNPSGTGL